MILSGNKCTVEEKAKILRDAGFNENGSGNTAGNIPPPKNVSDYLLNDIGAGDLFVDTYGDIVRYVADTSSFAVYTGDKWKMNAHAEVTEYSKILTSQIMPVMASGISDDNKRILWFKYCGKMQSNNAKAEMLRSASTKREINIDLADFDRGYRFFNVQNGVLDLEAMNFFKHDKTRLLSMIANVEYNPGVKFPRWERFIQQIMCYDEDRARFLKKSKGYSLLGNPVEDCLFIDLGVTTRNGKSTLERTMLNIFGDYGKTAMPETLAVNRFKSGNSSSPELARLRGVRYLNMPEPSKGLELDGAVTKQLTGRDPVLTRNLYQGFFEYIPQYVIWINSNYRPVVNDMTLFQSGRIFCIPFEAQFPEERQEKDLIEQFSQPEAKSAILNWLLDGLTLYREEGLRRDVPISVSSCTKDYADDSNTFGAFLRECIMNCENYFTLTKDVYRSYENWAKDGGYRPMSMKSLVSEMKRRGYRDKRKNSGSGFMDIILLTDFPHGWM